MSIQALSHFRQPLSLRSIKGLVASKVNAFVKPHSRRPLPIRDSLSCRSKNSVLGSVIFITLEVNSVRDLLNSECQRGFIHRMKNLVLRTIAASVISLMAISLSSALSRGPRSTSFPSGTTVSMKRFHCFSPFR